MECSRQQSLPLWYADSIRHIEQAWLQQAHQPSFVLMQAAGEAVLKLIKQYFPHVSRIWCFCGPGQNGGDGYCFASYAQAFGLEISVIAHTPPINQNSDAYRAYQTWLANGGVCLPDKPQGAPDLILDALFGIGLNRPLEAHYQQWIDWMNKSNVDIVAVDCPSGLDANTGYIQNCAVAATKTLTFIGCKTGLVTGQAADVVGQLHLASLCDVKPESIKAPDAYTVSYQTQKQYFPAIVASAHKGNFGRVVVYGGARGMLGAALLSGSAALRVGAGLVKLMVAPEHVHIPALYQPELMTASWQQSEVFDWADTYLIGSGLGQEISINDWWPALEQHQRPVVIDGDALSHLAQSPRKYEKWVLTPHLQEAARLLACDVDWVQRNRYTAARKIVHEYGGVVVLKGAGTIIDNGVSTRVCRQGNIGMARAGTGDVLAGVIAGLIAQGNSTDSASSLGVCMHAYAADLNTNNGLIGLLASDLFPYIRQLRNPLS